MRPEVADDRELAQISFPFYGREPDETGRELAFAERRALCHGCMPTLLRWKGYRFFFWSGDRGEPPHVNVKRGSAETKLWLDPVALVTAVDLRSHEIKAILRKVREQESAFLKAWHDHFRH